MQAEGLLDSSSLQPAAGVGGTGSAMEAVSWEWVWGGAEGAGACGEGAATQHAIQPDAATTEEEESRLKAALAVLFAAVPGQAEPSFPLRPPEPSLDGLAGPTPAAGTVEQREEPAGGSIVVSALEDGQHDASPDSTAFHAEPMLPAPERAESKVPLDGQPEARSDWQPTAVTAPEKAPLMPLAPEKRGEAWPGRTVADVMLRPSGKADSKEQASPQGDGDESPRSRVNVGSKRTGAGQPPSEPPRILAPGTAGERIESAGQIKPGARIRNGDAGPGAGSGGPEAMNLAPEQATDERSERLPDSDTGREAAGRSDPGPVQEEPGAHFRQQPEDAAQETGPRTDFDFPSAPVANPPRRMDRSSEQGTGSASGAETRRPAGHAIEPRPAAVRPDGQIDLQIDGQAGERVRIRFAEAPGGIRLRIASNDARLAESLRSGWASLEAALRRAGWEQHDAVSSAAEEAVSATASARPDHNGVGFRAGARLGDEGHASVPPSPSQDASRDRPGEGRSGQGHSDAENESREEWLELSALRRLARRRQE
jgi:hypothetical protein